MAEEDNNDDADEYKQTRYSNEKRPVKKAEENLAFVRN